MVRHFVEGPDGSGFTVTCRRTEREEPSPTDQRPSSVDEDLEETGSLGNCLDLAVGYKFPLGGSKFDMTAGAGYGVKVSGEGSGVPALDITLGYSF